MDLLHKAKELASEAAGKVADAAHATADAAQHAGSAALDAAHAATDKVSDLAHAAGDKLGDAKDAVASHASTIASATGDKLSDAKDAVFSFLDGKRKSIDGLAIAAEVEKRIVRQWKLRTDGERKLLREVLPRFDLELDQVKRILSDERNDWNIRASVTLTCPEGMGRAAVRATLAS